ncbi:MAG: glycogen/starch synthase [Alistipes sp.]|nr:glycogen/starch synthase [Candidatus Alistipes equi]
MTKKILYLCQQITPCLPEDEESYLCRYLPQQIQEIGCETRTFMPRFGCINERRNQLHEVIRLSGMNLIIGGMDHQLIIKVASIPSARIQIYFIDNEDYFARKATLKNAAGEYFKDNDERMIFFIRGALETVRKLRWVPDVVHCHGWFSALAAAFIKDTLDDDPVFKNTKIVVSLYDDAFPGELNKALIDKLQSEGIKTNSSTLLQNPSYENLYKFVLGYVDGVIAGSQEVPVAIFDQAKELGKAILPYQKPSDENFYENYNKFYENLL